ncbi:PP2C family protein-serine/threonine phosphatase [Gallaecimonas pentaromativorans]|uniref:PP2C family protein-serine/threonine phosphatase n=1 Tax=Gallaecimonas pentaromativorans TaxID=584787 RepID=UPI003A8FAD95
MANLSCLTQSGSGEHPWSRVVSAAGSGVSALLLENSIEGPCWHPLAADGSLMSANATRLSRDTLIELAALEQPTAFAAGLSPLSEVLTWVVPLPEQPHHRWLLLLDPASKLSQSEIEQIFLYLGWALTRQALQEARKELAEHRQLSEHAREEMSRLQQLMLPDPSLKIPGTEIAFVYRALRGAGGDYLDIVNLESDQSMTDHPHQMGVIIADATGHGPSAAVESAMVDAILRTYKPTEAETAPSEVLNYINRHFFTRKERGSLLTANLIRYRPEKKAIFYANAGHPHAYLRRGDRLITLDQGGIPIGVLRDYEWQSHAHGIEPGDILFIYTDVVIETKNPQQEFFGFERLEKALLESHPHPRQLIAHVENQLQLFCQCGQFQDDMTMCAIQFTE